MKILALLLLTIQVSLAQENFTPPLPSEGSEAVPELVKPEQSPVEETVGEARPVEVDQSKAAEASESDTAKSEPMRPLTTKELRAQSKGTAMIGYQFLTTWLPSKKTIGYTHLFNEKWSLEGEYSWATIDFPIVGVDLGEIKERRYTLHARRYVGNSFNFTFGAVYNDFKARVGSDFLDNLGNEIRSSFRAQNLGATLGLGNRWQWSNGITFGVDWFRVNIPVFQTRVEDKVLKAIPTADDQEDIKTVIRTLNRIPTVVLFGLNVGYTF